MLGARCFQNGHFGRIWSTLYFTVYQSLEGHTSARHVWHKPCFRQAHRFMQGPLRFLPVPSNPTSARSHTWGFRVWEGEGLEPGLLADLCPFFQRAAKKTTPVAEQNISQAALQRCNVNFWAQFLG